MAALGEAQYRLFISYSHDDEVLRRELDQHLALLRREGAVRIWHDREISAGEEWRGQIDEELEAAHLILLLVSASFIASDYCFDVETTRALERHRLGEARVIPVIVRSCDWQTAPFAELQALPNDGRPVTRWEDRDEAWAEVAKGLRKVIAEFRGHPTPPAGSRHGRKPRYDNDEIRGLSVQLRSLYRRRKDLTLAGGSTMAVEGEILDVRRLLRKGPQLRAGEFLGDGRYELLEPVGQGGFATVWRAWDTDAQVQVAVKVLHGHLSDDRSKRDRFFRGARKMAELTHPHIVQVLEKELSDDGWCFFVMEYLDGGNFEQAVLRGELTLVERLKVLLQVGDALLHAHDRGVVHRDVKPSNVLLDGLGRAKLTDFDLVRAQDTTGLTATRAMMGTVQFAAPEALVSAAEAGPATDVYALGSTAVFAIAGRRLPAWYFRDPAKAIAELDCGAELKQALEQATAFEVEERSSSSVELCRVMEQAARQGSPAQPGVPPVKVKSKAPQARVLLEPKLPDGERDRSGALEKKRASSRQRVLFGVLLVALAITGALGFLSWIPSGQGPAIGKNIWESVSPSVAHVRCRYYIERAQVTSGRAVEVTGSAVLIRPGLLLTTKHLVEPWRYAIDLSQSPFRSWEEFAQATGLTTVVEILEVQFPGLQPMAATTRATAETSDLALISISAVNLQPVPVVTTNQKVNVTDDVAIIGFPLNLGERQLLTLDFSTAGSPVTQLTEMEPIFMKGTVTRPLPEAGESSHFFFLDASIEPGNSGGPVLNKEGSVIGIVSPRLVVGQPIQIDGKTYQTYKEVRAGARAVSPSDMKDFLSRAGVF